MVCIDASQNVDDGSRERDRPQTSSTSMLHPFSLENFTAGGGAPENHQSPAHWFVFCGNQLLVQLSSTPPLAQTPYCIDLQELGFQPEHPLFLGHLHNTPCYGAILSPAVQLPPDWHLVSLRQLYGQLEDALFAIGGRAFQMVEWHRTHQFCSCCAAPLVQPSPTAKHCPPCNLRYYPKLSPAIIVRVTRGDEILLARSPRFRPDMYSVLAGFVEPGESLEETVRREVREEVGIEVDNICYFGSRPWPFPNSLMLAFSAEYAGGDLRPEPGEIEAVAWFTKDVLPEVPGPLSIARDLIDAFLASA